MTRMKKKNRYRKRRRKIYNYSFKVSVGSVVGRL